MRDKHFDWTATVEAITGLCGSSSIAILSRWRDRNFGWAAETLPIAINFLVSRGDLNPKLALTLTAFRAQWDKPQLLQKALKADTTKAEKQAVADFLYRYMTLEKQSATTWKKLKSILDTQNIAIPEISERIGFLELREKTKKSEDDHYITSHQVTRTNKNERNWGQIFSSIDFSSSNDIAFAYRNFMDSEPPYYHERFFEEACNRVITGKEAEFISAIAEVSDFDFYHLRYLLERLPESWKSRVSVKPALAKTIKFFCRRFCMEITRSRYYERLPLRLVGELSDLSEEEIITEVLTALGEVSDIANASRLFTLVGLLTPMMTKEHALEVLSFGLDLLDPILEASDGDGPWSDKFAPPLDIENSLAGYIWGCLAAPNTSLRWEAAHVVRALCTFNFQQTVKNLVEFARGASVSAFHDAHLHFYDMHARLWLLIGLSRAAKDYPGVVVDHTDFFTQLAFNSEPHVLVREFAKRTLLAILDAGLIDPKNNLRSRLVAVNTSPFLPLESDSNSYIDNDTGETDDDEDRFYFGIDIGPYWLAPLGRCFGKPQSLVEREVLRVIRDDWNLTTSSRWDEDERHKRRIYQDRETHHSHGSYPRSDELRFYLSYHAMMVAAGKLLGKSPVHNVFDECEDDFCEWLSRHDLTRSDYSWLADRRDPHPLERAAWQEDKETEDWRWQLTRNDFDKLLIPQENIINVWGHWNRMSGRRDESIYIRSALVSSDRSTALLRALQSVINPHDYRIPDAYDDLQIDFNGFQLKGWVIDQSQSSRLDEYDPWAGAISYPPPAPAGFIVEHMKLKSDAEKRRWFVENEDTHSLCSHTWGDFRDRDDADSNLESGTRLQLSPQFLFNLLHKLEMDLIVKVEIERRRRSSHWENNDDDEIRFMPASARLFLFKKDGSINTL